MKLYLSSYRLGNQEYTKQLINMLGENKRIAVIANAIDSVPTEEMRIEKVQRELDDLRSLGLDPEEIDLRRYFGKEEELKTKLSGFAAVWVRGGNTFILRRAFKYSGFDKWLLEKNKEKEFVYAGYSAGGCILSPTLKGIDLCDFPEETPSGYEREIIWDGLNIISFSFAPHYKTPGHPETELIDKSVEYFEANKMEYKTLSDGDVIILES